MQLAICLWNFGMIGVNILKRFDTYHDELSKEGNRDKKSWVLDEKRKSVG